MRGHLPLLSLSFVALGLVGCPSTPATDAGADAGGRRDTGTDSPRPPIDAGPELEIAGGDVMGSWCGAVHVTADVTVPAGQTLTVCAGSIVRFDAGTGMTVAGTLALAGTAAQRVTLRSDATWSGLDVSGTVTATFSDVTEAVNAFVGTASSAITFEDGTVVAAGMSGTVARLANGGRFDRTSLLGGNTIVVTGGILEMTDSIIDQMHPPGVPDCTDWAGGGMRLDHVHVTGCHCPIHINSADDVVSITNSILDGATNPIMIANCDATITHNNFSGTSTLVLDIGRGDGIIADVSVNYWDGGPPNVGTTRPDQFTGTMTFSMTPFTDVGPR
jgi:hypothetical protein